jgi:anti-sigma factor RsiW
MFASNRHPTDHELLRDLDDELSTSRRSAIDRHLRECERCRRRQAVIEQAALAASCLYRAATGSETMDASLERLKHRLSCEAREGAASGWCGGVTGRAATSRRTLVWSGATAMAAIVAWLFVSIASGRFLPGADPWMSLPVASITPGATWDVSTGELCAGTRHTRAITAAMRAQVLSAYRMEDVPADQYELDYLITPELGGATDARNLWPQGYSSSSVWNARVKDELESLLPRLVCRGALDLQTAQREMAVDWIAAYKKYFNTDQPLQAHRGPSRDDDEEMYALGDARPAPAVRLVSADRLPARALFRPSLRTF